MKFQIEQEIDLFSKWKGFDAIGLKKINYMSFS